MMAIREEVFEGKPEIIELVQTTSNHWKFISSMDCSTTDLEDILTIFRNNHIQKSGLKTFDRKDKKIYLYCLRREGEYMSYKLGIEHENENGVSKLTLLKKDNPDGIAASNSPNILRVSSSVSILTTPPRATRSSSKNVPRRSPPSSLSRGLHNPRNLALLQYLRAKWNEATTVAVARKNHGSNEALDHDVMYNFRNAIGIVKKESSVITKENFETFPYIGLKRTGELTNIGQFVLDFFEGI